jgi:dGTPase
MNTKIFENPVSSNYYVQRKEPRAEDIRGPYFRDQTAIIHSLPFRRLKHKAQVFFSPNNDHMCTRIEHALHIATIASTIAKGLELDTEMAYAIGLAHDLGHAPFGHAGESVLNEKSKDIGGFIHEIHGLRVVDKLGNRGKTLNLTWGVRDGIICHCGESPDKELEPRRQEINLDNITTREHIPASYEGCVARMADRIAYLGRDLEDAIYGGFIKSGQVPKRIRRELGETNGEIIDTLVIDAIETSRKSGMIALSTRKFGILKELYDFNMEHIYGHEAIERYKKYCETIVSRLFDHLTSIFGKWGFKLQAYESSPVPLDKRFGRYLWYMNELYTTEKASPMLIARDYVAGMTDGYALRCMKEISLPEELTFDVQD